MKESELNAAKIENEFYKNGFNKKQILDIAYNFSDLDSKNEPKYLLNDDSKIATEETLTILNMNTIKAKCAPDVDCSYDGDDDDGGTNYCSSYACWTCSPASDCSTSCTIKFKSCGLLSAFDCHAKCY
ncbi:hypothetical protein [Empedobacter brevis]|uniref:hypothetical protein n=1 Tax=Empedobacter brevis TaxID=247 RepID=UPI002896540D|nr:hypothetical protein [Empedobacter brevis]